MKHKKIIFPFVAALTLFLLAFVLLQALDDYALEIMGKLVFIESAEKADIAFVNRYYREHGNLIAISDKCTDIIKYIKETKLLKSTMIPFISLNNNCLASIANKNEYEGIIENILCCLIEKSINTEDYEEKYYCYLWAEQILSQANYDNIELNEIKTAITKQVNELGELLGSTKWAKDNKILRIYILLKISNNLKNEAVKKYYDAEIERRKENEKHSFKCAKLLYKISDW